MARVMIVEDDGLQAFFLSSILESAGHQVIGPALSVERALELLQALGCDAAILDYNLDGTSEPIVVLLRRDGIPFLLLTACGADELPPLFANTPIVNKPATVGRLLEALRELLA